MQQDNTAKRGLRANSTATYLQTFVVRGEMRLRFLAFAAQTQILCVVVPTQDPDAVALMGAGPHFETVMGPECLALCFALASQYDDNRAPLNEVTEWLRTQQVTP